MHSRHSPPVSLRISDITIREYRAGDEVQIVDTFNRAFAQVDPNFVPRTLERWKWQYLDNPSGWRIMLAFAPDDSLISQYAGVGQRVWLEGRPANFSQAVDSMTDPAYRRGLKKPGFFVLTGYPYFRYGGPPPDKDTVCWGAPVPSAWRIGKTYLGYRLIRNQLKLAVDPSALKSSAAGAVDVEEVASFPEDVGQLSAALAEVHGAVAVRDKAQMDWRFVRHPEEDYSIAMVRRSGRLLGYAVFKQADFDREEGPGLVADWCVAPGEEGAEQALVAWVRECALDRGADRLVALFPDTCPQWISFQRRGFRAEPTRYFLVCHCFSRRYRPRWLYDHWYYTLGDTDLV